MDIGSPRDKANSKALSGGLVNALDGNCCEALHIKDSSEHNTSDGDVASQVEGFEDLKLNDTKPGRKILCKYATLLLTSKLSPSATCVNEQDKDDELKISLQRMFSNDSVHSPCSCVISLPIPLKVVSAMKGSREKLGASPRKLNVKWDPDVYDPPPTIVSHTVIRRKKQHKSREDRNYKPKKAKKGRKGNSSHSGSKDKKQYRKTGGSTAKSYKLMDAWDGAVELPDGLNDFEVAGPDSCGSSFLKESLGKVHYSVAEAL